MKWNSPPFRVSTGFAIFPIVCAGNVTVWLQRFWYVQHMDMGRYIGCSEAFATREEAQAHLETSYTERQRGVVK